MNDRTCVKPMNGNLLQTTPAEWLGLILFSVFSSFFLFLIETLFSMETKGRSSPYLIQVELEAIDSGF